MRIQQRLLVALFLMAISLSSFAYDVQIDGIYYNVDTKTKVAEVTSRGLNMGSYYGDVIIPSSIEYEGVTCTVTYIGNYALAHSSTSSVTIPNSVTIIGSGAFYGNSHLSSITIPSSVTSIGSGAFGACSSLTSIIVEASNNKYDSREDCNAIIETSTNTLIAGCKNSVIPSSVTSIGENAFWDCSLTSFTIPNSVTSIGSGAFESSYYLTSITIPSSVTSIGENTFSHCRSLTSVTIPNSVTSIGSGAFSFCSSLTSIIVEASNNKYDSREDCNAIIETSTNTLVTGCDNTDIPSSVTSIGENAFCGCSLTSVTIPNSVTSIGNNAFQDCNKLTSVSIPNSVTSIGDNAFKNCRKLTSVSIPNSVTSIGDNAFYYCSSLTSITIPNSVTSIGKMAFALCSALTNVTIPNSVTSISGGTFSDCSSLTSITIPSSVTSIGGGAFNGCSSLTSITIPNSVTSIGLFAFADCTKLSTIISEIANPFTISAYTFISLMGNSALYNSATLYVPAHSIILYQVTDGWKEFQNIVPIEGTGKTISLSVNDSRMQDIAEQVTVFWLDTNAKQIGNGNSLNGIEEGDTVYYSVLLGEELGRKYREVIMQQVVVGSDTESLTCTLKEIPRIELAGRVSATDIDKNTVTLTVMQMLNGKYEQTYTTQTDEQGQFKIEVYDDVTDITLNGETYFDATLHRDGFAGNANMGVIPMNLLSGFAIAADVTLKKAIATGASEDIDELPGGLNNIEFLLYDATKGQALTDFTVQNGKLIIKSGASDGDEIRLTAKSKQGIFADATTTFFVEDGANSFVLELTEHGGIDVTYTSSSNGKTIGYLYDDNNTLVAKGSYVGDNLAMRHLPNGNYTLVTMGSSTLLGNLTNLSDLNAIGLNEGSDFVMANLSVTDGVLSSASISEVPRMDDSRFYYTSDNAYFSANKASVTAGNYIALSARVDLKPQYQGKVDDVQVSVDLPEGCQLVENSVIANRQVVPFTYSGNKLMMNLSQDQWLGEIRFCVIPVLNQTYAITAMASFDIDGGVSQPIGTAQFESKGLSLDTPSMTADTNITINGTAKGKSDVSIYDNDVLIGKTTSKADGTWTATCELYKPFSHSYHNIYAKVEGENGLELTSETKQVEYDKNNITPKSVTMTFYNAYYKENKTVEFNLVEGTTSPNSWPFYTAADFTFLADFTKNDSSIVKNVNIKVLNSDGTVRTLPAMFDGKQGKWVATTKYSSASRLPQNVKVEYDYIPQEESDDWREESILDQATVLANCANQIQQFFEDKEAAVIEDEDDHLTIEYMFDETTPIRLRIEKMDYADAERMMKEVQFVYVKTDEGIIGTYTEETENEVLVVAVDIEQNIALRMKMFQPSENDKIRFKKAAPIGTGSFICGKNIGLASTIGGGMLDLLGIGQYLNVRSDFDNMCNLIVKYTDTYNDARNRLIQKILAKCPDGSYRVADKLSQEYYYERMRLISDKESVFSERCYGMFYKLTC